MATTAQAIVLLRAQTPQRRKTPPPPPDNGERTRRNDNNGCAINNNRSRCHARRQANHHRKPSTTTAPPQLGANIGAWEYLSFSNSLEDVQGYTAGWSDQYDFAVLYLAEGPVGGCYPRIVVSRLLHGDNRTADVRYRISGDSSILETWWSDEEYDSGIQPDDEQTQRIYDVLRSNDDGELYVSFVSRYDGDMLNTTFDISRVQDVLSVLGC